MKVVTRAAPGASGPLHLGSLYNAFLNYVFAKKHGGVFFLRLDAPHKTGPSIRFEREIEETLRAFGLVPDFVVKQSERRNIYRKQLEDLLDHPDVYFCNCSTQDITRRFSKGAKAYFIDRHDKYPPPCTIRELRVFDAGSHENLAVSAKATASVTAPGGFEVENVLSVEEIWKPFGPWYYGKVSPVLTLEWKEPISINTVQIIWSRYPVKAFEIWIDGRIITTIDQVKSCWWQASKTVDALESNAVFKSTIWGRTLQIIPTEFIRVAQKEYAYDGYCRNRNLILSLDNDSAVVRKLCNDFVDVVLWNGRERKVDLAFRSAVDDLEFGTTHKIRGIDINIFAQLEEQCANLIDHKPLNIFHGLILHPSMYKFSKSTGAKDVRSYLQQGSTPEELLSFLAWKTGLITDRKIMSLQNLIENIKLPNTVHHTVISS